MAVPGEAALVDGLRLGSLVEIKTREKASSDAGISDSWGQLLSYDRSLDQFEVMLLSGEVTTAAPSSLSAPDAWKKPGVGGDETSFDVLFGPRTDEVALAEEIATCIFEKGFCVIRLCQARKELEASLEAVRSLADQGLLGRLPQEVEAGYLGTDGRGKVMWMDPDGLGSVRDEALRASDEGFSHLASMLQPYSEDCLGQTIDERSPSLVSLSLLDEEEDDYPYPMADDKTLGDYLGTWQRGLLRAVHFLGPNNVPVTLESLGGPKTAALPNQVDSVTLTASPHTLLVFRTECYGYKCGSDEETLTMMATFLAAPPRFELVGWTGDKRTLALVSGGPPPPRRDGINIMHTQVKLPGNWDAAEMYRAGLQGGIDCVVEIPVQRFDAAFYYCDDPAELLNGPPRTVQKHTSLVEGAELFDNTYFEITKAEAQAMDPLQRQILDVGGELLFSMGITKKISNRSSSHAGCSVGLDKADFPTLNLNCGASQGGNALAIIANRFSFVFNMKGPNYICDTACSSSITATHLAKPLLLDRVFDVLDFHIATGTHLCLSPGPWIGCSTSSMVSPQGRCFSFDASANGYLRGEGTSGMLMKYGAVEDKDRLCIFRASQCGQDGRSASLTAPNGPAQEMIIAKALKEADISTPETTVWECHGTGTSLGDPIEVGAVRKIQIKEDRTEPLIIATVKSTIGHLEGGAAMTQLVKAVQMVSHTESFSSQHLRSLNPHLENSLFDFFIENECNDFRYNQGHADVSSFGFGGSNGHVIFWGENIGRVPSVSKQIMKRLSKMSPPEVRPLGDDPAEWESDLPDPDSRPGDKYSITINPEDPPDAPLKWVKEEAAPEDDDDSAFYGIVGNFNSWEDERMMPGEARGQHRIVVEVPDTGVVEFRFLKDGDMDKVIAPATASCTKKSAPVKGPSAGLSNTWSVAAQPGSDLQVELLAIRGKFSVLWFAN